MLNDNLISRYLGKKQRRCRRWTADVFGLGSEPLAGPVSMVLSHADDGHCANCRFVCSVSTTPHNKHLVPGDIQYQFPSILRVSTKIIRPMFNSSAGYFNILRISILISSFLSSEFIIYSRKQFGCSSRTNLNSKVNCLLIKSLNAQLYLKVLVHLHKEEIMP